MSAKTYIDTNGAPLKEGHVYYATEARLLVMYKNKEITWFIHNGEVGKSTTDYIAGSKTKYMPVADLDTLLCELETAIVRKLRS